MVVNPAGFQGVFDFGAPKIISAYARQAITGGQFVFISGASGVVSSGTNSFATSDISVATGASGTNPFGVAMQTCASGALVPVLIEGCVIVTADGTCTASLPQICGGNDSVQDGTAAGTVVGQSLATAASGGYTLLYLRR